MYTYVVEELPNALKAANLGLVSGTRLCLLAAVLRRECAERAQLATCHAAIRAGLPSSPATSDTICCPGVKSR